MHSKRTGIRAPIVLLVLLILSLMPGVVAAEENTDMQFFRDDNVAMGIDHSKPNSYLVYDLQKRLIAAKAGSMELTPGEINEQLPAISPPSGWKPAVASKGNPKILVFLVDFPDYPHGTSQGYSDVYYKMADRGGNYDDFPTNNLHDYYYRSSYGQLNLSVTVKTWYRAAHERSYYTNNQWELFQELMTRYDSEINFAEYDNDKDGDIDDMWIIWTGPNEGWSSRWWSYHTGWNYNGNPPKWDGVYPREFVWEWYTRPWSTSGLFDPRTACHEFGHSLGLPDYYDYNGDIGPDGGVGGFDMMDGNWPDHNAFSKYLLGWTQPFVLGSDPVDTVVELNPYGSTTVRSSVIIFPGVTANEWSEFFLVENRVPGYGNDPEWYWTWSTTKNAWVHTDWENRGLTIWHVDASLNDAGDGFRYDNSYTDHKLLRLMEADGKEHIEQNYGWDPADMYAPSQIFWPTTSPNSSSYAGEETDVKIRSIAAGENGKTTARFMIGDYPPLVTSISPSSGVKNTDLAIDITGYYFWPHQKPTVSIWFKRYIGSHWFPFQRNASYVQVIDENHIFCWLDLTGIPEGTYTLYVEYPGGEAGSLANALTVEPPGLQVTSPNGNEEWPAGSTRQITWTQEGLDGTNVRIDLYKDGPPGVHQMVINTSVSAGSGSYQWIIPADLVPYRYYTVNITSLSYPAISDRTDDWLEIRPVPAPNISVTKWISRDNVSWVDDSLIVPAGSKVYYYISARNNGNVPLTSVTVQDNEASATCSNLARRAVCGLYYAEKAGTAPHTNSATARGTSADGDTPVYSDDATYYPVIPLPDYKMPPTDPDSDGIFEDLNGNKRLDFADVVLYFNQMEWIAANEPICAFDLNGNGRIDFADIVKLFGEI